MEQLGSFIEASDDQRMSRMGFLLTIAGGELADELGELDELQTRVFMFQMGEVISWIGHGDNTRLPDAVREMAEAIQPTPAGGDDGSHIALDSASG
jgi:hypothetical protein